MNCCQLDHLLTGFARSAEQRPDATALVVDGQALTYAQLAAAAGRIATAILRESAALDGPPLTAVLAARSPCAYAAVLGALAAGHGYVPLNPQFPVERSRQMLLACGARTIVVDEAAAEGLPELLHGLQREYVIICPQRQELPGLSGTQRCVGAAAVAAGADTLPVPQTRERDTAYLLFTSGSTGRPKGVAVSHANVCAYLEFMGTHLGAGPGDRFSQNFDLTFDLSVHDLFVSWSSAACLVCTPQRYVMAPGRLIREHELTMWFAVPSVIRFMARMRMLKPGAFPSLRRSLFCGEPLSAEDAAAWRRAAPNATLENLYGPTEATIAITGYRWEDRTSPAACQHGIVPIGRPFDGQRCRVVEASGRLAAAGSAGELWLAGSQVTPGYLDDAERTAQRFVTAPDEPEVTWYRTGDVVSADDDGCLHFLGRVDQQVQVLGHRVELQEIEQALREAAGQAGAVALPWPPQSGRADVIYAFVAGAECAEHDMITACRARLPEYMVPKRIFRVAQLPLNANGKVDRGALGRRLGEPRD